MTKLELMGDLDARISASKVKGFWSDAQKLVWLNDAGKQVCNWRSPELLGFKRWQFLEVAMETVTRNQKEYYDVPDIMKNGSIYQIDIDGETLAREGISWDLFQKAKDEESLNYYFANHETYYFLSPIPDDGKTMSVYGERKWVNLSGDTDTPITPEDLDVAIVRIALASCLRKAKKYGEASEELQEVINPRDGIIAMFAQQYVVGGQKGYVGQARHSRS